ncbi:MAG: transcription termination/antitermination protein NusG [Cytophagales bacterium]
MQLKWYALRVRQSKEIDTTDLIKAAFQKENLESSLGRMHVLLEPVLELKKNKQKIKNVYFGYLLVEVDMGNPKVKDALLGLSTVLGFIIPQNKWTRTQDPVPIPEEEVTHMLSGEGKRQNITDGIATQFQVGDQINIIEGPFKGRKGTFHGLDKDHDKIDVVLELFRQDTVVSFNYNQIQKNE